MPKAKRGQWSNDHFPPGMKAVLMIVNRQVKIIEYPPEGNEVFPRIVYTINPLSNGGVALTSLTEEELDAQDNMPQADDVPNLRPLARIPGVSGNLQATDPGEIIAPSDSRGNCRCRGHDR
jgi:hypothetical protein